MPIAAHVISGALGALGRCRLGAYMSASSAS
jgi:hypothetical protein